MSNCDRQRHLWHSEARQHFCAVTQFFFGIASCRKAVDIASVADRVYGKRERVCVWNTYGRSNRGQTSWSYSSKHWCHALRSHTISCQKCSVSCNCCKAGRECERKGEGATWLRPLLLCFTSRCDACNMIRPDELTGLKLM